MPRRVMMVSFAAFLALLAAGPSAAQAPAARFTERAFVTAIDVVAEVRDAKGATPGDLTPADFQLRENGIERRIIAIDYLNPSAGRSAGSPAPAPSSPSQPRPEWRVVVWFDAMTMSRATLLTSGRALVKRAPELVRFGPVTVVYSDLSSEVLVDATRDPKQLARVLEAVLKRPPGDRITRIRRDFIAAVDNIIETTLLGERILVGPVDSSVPAYVAEEDRLLQIGRTNLTRWLARTPHRVPRLLLYVGDGFDLEPAEFYLQTLRSSGDATVDLGETRSRSQTTAKQSNDALARQIALGGWTALAIGGANTRLITDATRGAGRRFSVNQAGVAPTFIFVQPDEPLAQLAEHTGGERIAHPAALPKALADIAGRVRITYQVDREPDPEPRRIKIVPLRAGLTVRSTGWASSTTTEGTAEWRAIELLSGEGARGDLQVSAALRPAEGGSASRAVEAKVDFAPLRDTAQRIGATKVRVTVAIELPGEPAAVFHRVVDLEDLAAVPGLSWSAPIVLPERAGAIAVVAEELTTGSWGGTRIGDRVSAPIAAPSSAVPPTAPTAAADPVAVREEAFAGARAERKPVIAFEWGTECGLCGEIETNARSHPEISRLMQQLVLLAPTPATAEPRIAVYDPSGRLFLSWPAIPPGRTGPLSTGELTSLLQHAADAAPYLLRAHDLFARGAVADGHLATGLAYREAEDPVRAETAYANAAREATGAGDHSKAQTARVLGAMMIANQGRPEDAIVELQRIAAAPATPLNEAEALLVVGMIRRAQGNEKDATAALDRTLELAPESSAAFQTAVTLLRGRAGAASIAQPAAASRPLQLVVGGRPPFSGKSRVQVIVRDPAVSAVAFQIDDGPAVADPEPPFEATMDLGAVPRRREIRAIARDDHGRVAAEDVVVVNERHDEFWVRLRPVEGSRMVRAETNLPEGARLAGLEFFVDGIPASALGSDAAVIRVEPGDDGVVVRVIAELTDDRQAEDASLVGATGYLEAIEARDVEIYAAVLDADGAPPSAMDRSQFTIEENGRKKRIAGFEFLGRAPFSVGLAIDSSNSMIEVMPDVHRSARSFVERVVADGSTAFVIDFDTAPRLAAARTDHRPTLHDAIAQIRAEGSTALFDAVIFGLLQLQGVPGKRALIVLTDGRDETSRYGFRDAARVARESGVAIYAIILAEPRASRFLGTRGGSRWGVDPDLERLAIETGGRAWYLPQSADMDAIYAAIDLELRNQYRLTYRTAAGRGASDWREVKVAVDVPGATVRTAAGFVAR